MPISQAWFRRSNVLLLAVGVAVLALIVSASLWLTAASERYFEQVTAGAPIHNLS